MSALIQIGPTSWTNAVPPPSDWECPVCYTTEVALRVSLRCEHPLCANCMQSIVQTQYNPSCPMCRDPFPEAWGRRPRDPPAQLPRLRLRCPGCHETEFGPADGVRSRYTYHPDGTRTRLQRCRRCAERHIAVYRPAPVAAPAPVADPAPAAGPITQPIQLPGVLTNSRLLCVVRYFRNRYSTYEQLYRLPIGELSRWFAAWHIPAEMFHHAQACWRVWLNTPAGREALALPPSPAAAYVHIPSTTERIVLASAIALRNSPPAPVAAPAPAVASGLGESPVVYDMSLEGYG